LKKLGQFFNVSGGNDEILNKAISELLVSELTGIPVNIFLN